MISLGNFKVSIPTALRLAKYFGKTPFRAQIKHRKPLGRYAEWGLNCYKYEILIDNIKQT